MIVWRGDTETETSGRRPRDPGRDKEGDRAAETGRGGRQGDGSGRERESGFACVRGACVCVGVRVRACVMCMCVIQGKGRWIE